MIVGITAPDTGTIELFGKPVSAESQNRIGYLPEERGLYKRMKVGDQLKFFAELKNFSGREAEQAVDRWLEKVKLSEWKRKKSSELSKGMQQKVQFIAAVLHDPDLIILDEPFSGLDPVNVELLENLVLELKAAGKTIIFSTHQMEVAERICDDICLINRSRDRKSTRLNSSHTVISYAVFCLKKKKKNKKSITRRTKNNKQYVARRRYKC